jgi:flagellar motor switch protein FliG
MSVEHMPAEAKTESTELSGIRRAAILLVSLGDGASAELIRQLPQDDVQKVTAEIALLESVPGEHVENVLEQFHQQVSDSRTVVTGGSEFAQKLLSSAFGAEPAERLMAETKRLNEGLGGLNKADPQQLAGFVQREHPQTIAVILSHFEPAQAAVLLRSLPAATRSDVVARIASLDKLSPAVLERVSAVLGARLQSFKQASRKATGGPRTAAEILTTMDIAATDEILAAIEQKDPILADGVRNLMIVFDNLLALAKEGVSTLLSRVDRKVLTLALKGTNEEMKAHFTQCMSQRASEMMREDMEALGPVKLRDVKAAQKEILTLVRQLQGEGVLDLKGADEYVV